MKIEDLIYPFSSSVPIATIDSAAPEELSTIASIFKSVAKRLKTPMFVWDFSRNYLDQVTEDPSGAGIIFKKLEGFQPGGYLQEKLNDVLDYIGEYDERAVFVLIDVHPFLDAQTPADLQVALPTIRRVKSLFFKLKQTRKRIIFLGQDVVLHSDLAGLIREVKHPLPDLETIATHVEYCLSDLRSSLEDMGKKMTINLSDEERDRLHRACQGLTLEEIFDLLREQTIRMQLGGKKFTLGVEVAEAINTYKVEKLRRYQVEFSEPPDVAVGGLDLLKKWFDRKVKLFGERARQYNLSYPKGALLVGPPGSGKSLSARTIQTLWGVPMFKVNIGALMGSLVGESEKNLRNVLHIAEACAPCIMYIDEIDKSGLSATSDGDAGTSRRILQELLSWMSDRTKPVFVVATANRVAGSGLPPEFFRKGRFDAIFMVDLPQFSERVAIAKIHLAKMGVTLPEKAIEELASATVDFSGAEIADAINSAAEQAFDEGRPGEATLADILAIARTEIPLAEREKEAIGLLRDWAKTYARPASTPEQEPVVHQQRRSAANMMDLDVV